MALALAACGGESGRRPDVLVVLVDTLRADRLGSYGSARDLTPFLDVLAESAVVFERAYAPSSWTSPSVASLFTSRYPSQHGAVRYDARLADGERTLAEALADAGYETAGFVANLRLARELGFGQGFSHWQVYTQFPAVSGSAVSRDALRWLDARRSVPGRPPLLLYVHYMEPHSPYDPPEPFRGRFLRPGDSGREAAAAAHEKLEVPRWGELSHAEVELLESLYDGEVAALDSELWNLFRRLKNRQFLRNAIVVVTSDHGEEFLDHGMMSHGHTLYEESIRVPLLLVAPGFPGGFAVGEEVSLVDLAPTVIDLTGLAPESGFEGRSLVEWLRPRARAGAPDEARAGVLSELESTGASVDYRRHARAWVRRPLKLIVGRDGRRELFDLGADPAEARPRGAEEQRTALIAALEDRRRALAARAGPPAPAGDLAPGLREMLRALGYAL